MIAMEDLSRALIGLDREIAVRDMALQQLRSWYQSRRRRPGNTTYSLRYFYTHGPQVMLELNKLLSIRADVEKILSGRLYETP